MVLLWHDGDARRCGAQAKGLCAVVIDCKQQMGKGLGCVCRREARPRFGGSRRARAEIAEGALRTVISQDTFTEKAAQTRGAATGVGGGGMEALWQRR